MKTFLTILISAVLATTGTWFYLKSSGSEFATSASGERKVLYYQSAMHPWIKSDKPGRCTICGMELTPVYAGEKGFDDSGAENIVALSESQIRVINVTTEEITVRNLGETLKVAGTIDDDERKHRFVSAYVDGRIDTLFANHHGAPVVKGEPLAMIYSPSLLQAEREYRSLSGDLKKAAALRLKQMGLTDAQILEVEKKPEDTLHSMILAPLTGTVVTHQVYEGQYVKEGDMMLEIADFSVMWFLFDAYEQDLPSIKVGQKIDVTLPTLPGKTFSGFVSFIDPNFNEATRTTKIRVELPNPIIDPTGRRELFHKVYAEGVLEIGSPPVLAVPCSAVIQTSQEAVVYLDQDGGAYAQTPVKIGRRGADYFEVLQGLKAGDKVVTNGTLLIDGQAEMNRSFVTPSTKNTPVSMKIDLSALQQETIQNFIKLADAMAAALSADDLTTFNKVSELTMTTTASMTESLGNIASMKDNLEALSNARHFHGFEDLKSARAAFHKLTVAATTALEPLRKAGQTPEFQIYECPMVDQAIPGAPKKARWIQTGGRDIANPFFGASMLGCGKEIKP